MKSFLITLFIVIVLLASLGLFYVDYGPVKLYPVLHYRHIASSESGLEDHVNPLIYKLQIKYLYDNKFNVVPLKDVVRTYRQKGEVPKRTVAITFDGGYQNFNEVAYPLLKKYKFPATVFLSPTKIDTKGYMKKDKILDLYEEGLISFGSMGRGSKKDLTRVSGSAAYEDIFTSRSDLRRILDIPINYFSYPDGGVNVRLMHYAKESKYKGACTLIPGAHIPRNHSYAIKRVTIHSEDGAGLKFKFKTWGNFVLFKEWRKK